MFLLVEGIHTLYLDSLSVYLSVKKPNQTTSMSVCLYLCRSVLSLWKFVP